MQAGLKEQSNLVFHFLFKFLPRSTQKLEVAPFFLYIQMFVANYYSWDCDPRTELQQALQSPLLFSEVALLILEVGKARFSTCQAARAKYFEVYFIQSIARQSLRSVPEVGRYCRSKPEIMFKEEPCDSLRRGKGSPGKAGTTPGGRSHSRELTQHRCPAPTTLQRPCPKAHTQKSLPHSEEGALLGIPRRHHGCRRCGRPKRV